MFSIFGLSMNSCGFPHYTISPREKAVNKALARNAKILAKKYHMNPVGNTVAMPGGDIQYLELEFQIHGPLSKNEIRKVLINSAHDFLADLNSDSELCSYLKNHSFSLKEIGLGLFLTDFSGRGLKDPEIGIAKISKGKLEYYKCDSVDMSVNGMIETQESYKTAIQILENGDS
ncbi:MAG: hypothetical protein WAM28_03175 [Chlamydiales bacterium]